MKANVLYIVLSVALLLAGCTNEEINKDNDTKIKSIVTFQSSEEPPTRTTMTHEMGGKGIFFWTTDDNLWVDNGGLISSISSNITDKVSRASFDFTGSFTATDYPVYYTGKNSAAGNRVTIATAQTQTAPNNFSHLGVSGDCGTATAERKATGIYKFQLKHKAAYLCFVPREEDAALGQNIYLTKVVITSTDNIAGTYDFSSGSLPTNPIGGTGSKTITLTTKGSGAYTNGFPLTNTMASITNNGAYAVIAPGQHDLLIQYYIYDPETNIESFITKHVVKDFKVNTVTDVTANLKITKVDLDKYTIWDAKKNYWYGYESVQPKKMGITANANIVYPEDRVGRSGGMSGHAINNCKNCPNGNEYAWYVQHGDPHWDANELFSFANHLYKGGAWILKSSNISGFRSDQAPDGNDYTNKLTTSMSVTMNQTPLTYADRDRYFFLPAAGSYVGDMSFDTYLAGIGIGGNYWSSSDGDGSINYATLFSFSPSYLTPGTYEMSLSCDGARGWGWNYQVHYIGEMGGLFQ